MSGSDDDRRGEDGSAAVPGTASAGERAPGMTPARSMSTWLGRDVTPETVAAFFAAAAALWRAAPWRIVPEAGALLSVSSAALMLEDVLSVSGQADADRALRLFADLEEFETFERLVATTPEHAIAEPPVYFAIAFVTADALAPSLREEITRHGWEVAAEDAWPLPWSATPDTGFDVPTAIELENAEGVARALVAALAEPEPLRAALAGGAPFSREFEIVCGGDDATVTIGAPVMPPPERSLSVAELLVRSGEPLAADEEDEESFGATVWRLERELLRRFALAAEPPPTNETLAYCRYTLAAVRGRFDHGIAEITPEELERILLEDVPRELDITPLEAYRYVEINRAFLEFLEREADPAQAGASAESLDDAAVMRLEDALADPSRYSPAKTARMAVLEAGLKPDSDEAKIVWMKAFERALAEQVDVDAAGPLAFSDVPPPQPQRTPAERKTRKKKRKSARKARRKNR